MWSQSGNKITAKISNIYGNSTSSYPLYLEARFQRSEKQAEIKVSLVEISGQQTEESLFVTLGSVYAFNASLHGLAIGNVKQSFCYPEEGYPVPLERYYEVYDRAAVFWYMKDATYFKFHGWIGNCYGMATVAASIWGGYNNVLEEYNTNFAKSAYDGIKYINGMKYYYLKKASELTKLIERYQISQYLIPVIELKYGCSIKKSNFASKIPVVISTLENSNEAYIIYIKYLGNDSEHTLVYDKSIGIRNDGDITIIPIYDCNFPKADETEGPFIGYNYKSHIEYDASDARLYYCTEEFDGSINSIEIKNISSFPISLLNFYLETGDLIGGSPKAKAIEQMQLNFFGNEFFIYDIDENLILSVEDGDFTFVAEGVITDKGADSDMFSAILPSADYRFTATGEHGILVMNQGDAFFVSGNSQSYLYHQDANSVEVISADNSITSFSIGQYSDDRYTYLNLETNLGDGGEGTPSIGIKNSVVSVSGVMDGKMADISHQTDATDDNSFEETVPLLALDGVNIRERSEAFNSGKRMETDKEYVVLSVGESTTILAQTVPENLNEDDIVFESEDDLVATVSASGEVMAISPGVVWLNVSSESMGVSARVRVDVVEVIPENLQGELTETSAVVNYYSISGTGLGVIFGLPTTTNFAARSFSAESEPNHLLSSVLLEGAGAEYFEVEVTDDRYFSVKVKDEVLLESVKNKTFQFNVLASVVGSETAVDVGVLSLKVTATIPVVRASFESLNMFYPNESVELNVSVTGAEIADVSIINDVPFVLEDNQLKFDEALFNTVSKQTYKVDYQIYLVDFKEPIVKTASLRVIDTEPKLSADKVKIGISYSPINTEIKSRLKTMPLESLGIESINFVSESQMNDVEKLRYDNSVFDFTTCEYGNGTFTFSLNTLNLEKRSYRALLEVTFKNTTNRVRIPVTVMVDSKPIKIKFKKSSAVINTSLPDGLRFVELPFTLSQENAVIGDMVCLVKVGTEVSMLSEFITVEQKANTLRIEIKDSDLDRLPTSLTLMPYYQGELVRNTKVSFAEKLPAVSAKPKGKVDAVIPDSYALYTVRQLNIDGLWTDISLDSDLYEVFDDDPYEKTFKVRRKPDNQISRNDRGKFGLTLTYETGEGDPYAVETLISITPTKSSVKLKSINALALHNNDINMPTEVCLDILSPCEASISQIELISNTDLFTLEKAYGDRYMLYFNPDGYALPKRYKLKFAVSFEGCTDIQYISIPLKVSGVR